MAQQPCSPEEVRKAAELLNKGAHKKSNIVDSDEGFESIQNPSTGAEAKARQHLGFFSRGRNMYGVFGDYLGANAINRVVQADTKRNNMIGNAFKEFNDAVKPLATRYERWVGLDPAKNKQLFEVIEKIGKDGKFINPQDAKLYAPEYVKAAQKIRQVFNKLAIQNEIDPDTFINGYMPHVRARQGASVLDAPDKTELENAFISKLTAGQRKFIHAFERTGNMVDYDTDAASVFSAYLHASGNRMMDREFQRLEREVILPYFEAATVKNPTTGKTQLMVNNKTTFEAWREYRHSVLGGLTEGDRRNADNLSKLFGAFGYAPASPRHVYQASHFLSSMFYTGAMGLRPASVIRQFGQLVPSFAEFGPRYTRQALQAVMGDIATPGNPLIQSLKDRGLMSSHIESLVQSVDVGRSVGKNVSAMADVMLKGVAASDSFTRAATAVASDLRFDQFLKEGRIGQLPGASEIKEVVLKAVNAGQIQEAKDLYALENLRVLQYIYGRANRPEFMRGAVGNLFGAFMSYPINTFEMLNYMTRRAVKGIREEGVVAAKDDWLPLARLMGVTTTMMYAGSEFLDADLNSMFITGSMPHSMAFPKMALDTWTAGSSSVEYLTGKLFQTGETDFHKQQRHQSYRDSTRAMKGFIPGYGAYNDFSKVLDSGSITRALALTPKGDTLNRERQIRREMERLNND